MAVYGLREVWRFAEAQTITKAGPHYLPYSTTSGAASSHQGPRQLTVAENGVQGDCSAPRPTTGNEVLRYSLVASTCPLFGVVICGSCHCCAADGEVYVS